MIAATLSIPDPVLWFAAGVMFTLAALILWALSGGKS